MSQTTIATNTSEADKAKLRKVKKITDKVKQVLYNGVTQKGGQGVVIQFNTDLGLYGLWEALLYVEGYEEDGYYVPGTAQAAVKMALS